MKNVFGDSGSFAYVSFLVCVLASVGCETSMDLNPDLLPEVEPTAVDPPDAAAVERFKQADRKRTVEPTDWPQLFGPDRTSAVQTQANPIWGNEGPPELWSVKVGTGYGSPVVSAGRVVFTHREGDEEIVQCVDAESGEPIWGHRYPTTFVCKVEYSDGPYATPVIFDGDVYAVGSQGQVFCLNLNTGEVKWSRDLHQEYQMEDDLFPVGSAPGIVGDRLIFNLGAVDKDAGVIAIDRQSGKTLWESTDQGMAYCSPFAATIHGEPFVFVVTNIGLVSLHPETGKVDWMIEHRCRSPMSYNSVSPLVYEDKVLVVTGPGPGALCVQVQADRSYQQIWKNRRVIDCQYNTLMLSADHVYAFTAAGQGGAELRCVEINTGQLKWKYHSLLRRGQGLIAGDAMIILGEQGHLASLVVSARTPQVLAFTEQPLMSPPCYCAPAIADGRLYLKDEQRVACFQLNERGQ